MNVEISFNLTFVKEEELFDLVADEGDGLIFFEKSGFEKEAEFEIKFCFWEGFAVEEKQVSELLVENVKE